MIGIDITTFILVSISGDRAAPGKRPNWITRRLVEPENSAVRGPWSLQEDVHDDDACSPQLRSKIVVGFSYTVTADSH